MLFSKLGNVLVCLERVGTEIGDVVPRVSVQALLQTLLVQEMTYTHPHNNQSGANIPLALKDWLQTLVLLRLTFLTRILL